MRFIITTIIELILLIYLFWLNNYWNINTANAINKYEYSQELIALIKNEEGFRAKPYVDLSGVKAVGYGHIIQINEYWALQKISERQAEKLLITDLDIAKKSVDSRVKVPLSNSQREALYALVYNIGAKPFSESTLLRDINSNKAENIIEKDFKKFRFVKNKTQKTLYKRRNEEWRLWGRETPPNFFVTIIKSLKKICS